MTDRLFAPCCYGTRWKHPLGTTCPPLPNDGDFWVETYEDDEDALVAFYEKPKPEIGE